MRNKAGFTIIEMLAVLAILIVLCAVVVGVFLKFDRVESVNKDTETILETLRSARNQTLASKNQLAYGVHFASSTVILFSGSSYSVNAGDNVIVKLNSEDTILSVTLSGNGNDVIFKRLSGTTDDFGTVVVTSRTSSNSRSVTIYSTGLVQGPSL